MNDSVLNFEEILKLLKRHIKLIIGLTLIIVSIVGYINFNVMVPLYKTSIKLFVGKDVEEQLYNYQYADIQMYQQLSSTYAELVKSEDLIQRAIQEKDIGMSTTSILGSLTVNSEETSQFITMTVTTPNPNDGKIILEAITDELDKYSNSLIPNGCLKVVNTPKIPTVPFTPNKRMNIINAAVMGVIISIILALILEFIDSRVKSKDDIENLLGVPVIGEIPFNKNRRKEG